MRRLAIVAYLVANIAITCQASAGWSARAPQEGFANAPPAAAPAHRDVERYRLAVLDTISVTFPLTPDFNQTVTIQPDGYASLSGAGDVRLLGLTTAESATAIREAYAPILHDPIITVEVKDFEKPYFIATGEVGRPGKYDLRGEMTASQAIAVAGGFNDAAKHSHVLLFRRVSRDWFEVRPIDLKRILQGRDVNEDALLQSGDMLVVPQNVVSKIKRFIPSSGVGAYYQLHP